MISGEERQYLYWLCRDDWSGGENVIEFGPWLGGSTYCLAEGMRANPRRRAASRLYVVDNFKWRPFMEERAPLGLADGDTFRPYFEHNLCDQLDVIRMLESRLPDDRTGDIEFDAPIRDHDTDLPLFTRSLIEGHLEIVFIDGAKSWKALAHLLRELGPISSSNAAYVFQDFKNWASYWVPMLVNRLGSKLTIEHILPFNTVTFRYAGGPPPPFPESIDDIGAAEGQRSIDEAALMLERHHDGGGADVVRLSSVAFLGAKGLWAEAIRVFRDVEQTWTRGPASELEVARRWLTARTGEPLPQSLYAKRQWMRWETRRKAKGLRQRFGRAAKRTRAIFT